MTERYIVDDGSGGIILLETDEPIAGESIMLSALEAVSKEDIQKPYPNEHYCQVESGEFDDYRRGSTLADGKPVGLLYGKRGGDWVLYEYLFPKGEWRVAQARSFCSRHGGKFGEASTRGKPDLPGEEPGSGAAQKSADEIELSVRIAKSDAKRHLVYGIALEPHKLDSYNDWESPDEIEMAAHQYLLRSLFLKEAPIGAEHAREIAAAPVESYIAPVNFWFEGTPHDDEHKVKKGSWVLVAKVFDDEEWERVERNEYTGWSIQGTAYRRRGDALGQE